METTLGKRISACRKQLDLTQEQLAEKLGLTAQAVSKWENDISCPDITTLPKLADIFGITTDTLLGYEIPVRVKNTEVVSNEHPGTEFEYDSDSGNMNFHWEGAKVEGIGLACWVMATGAIYLVAQLLHIDVSFWNILWPTFLLTFGLFGVYPKFSVLRLSVGFVGAYFLAEKMQLLSKKPDSGIIIGAVVILLGLGLLIDALRRSHRNKTQNYGNISGNNHHSKITHDYSVDGNSFSYDASFGSSTQLVSMNILRSGTISTNFGEYTVDLRGVTSIESGCRLQADCSFGELTILVPSRYLVIPDSSTSFAGFDIQGSPDPNAVGNIHITANVSFGEIRIRYI